MHRSILVPLDGSTFSEQALPLAMGVARQAKANPKLIAVAAHPWLLAAPKEASSAYCANTWQAYLERIVERVRSHSIPASFELLTGEDIACRIAAQAKSSNAELIVMTTHGRGALGRFWLGSVALELMRISPAPLLLAPPDEASAKWENDSFLKHVLVPLDGSSLAEQIIERAVTFGGLVDADYTLLRIVTDLPRGAPELDWISLSSLSPKLLDEIRAVQKRVQTEAENYLEGVAKTLRARGLRVQTRVVIANDPGAGILSEAGAPEIGLVALETQGRHGLSNLLVGSVARKVACGATKPVLVQSAASLSPSQG